MCLQVQMWCCVEGYVLCLLHYMMFSLLHLLMLEGKHTVYIICLSAWLESTCKPLTVLLVCPDKLHRAIVQWIVSAAMHSCCATVVSCTTTLTDINYDERHKNSTRQPPYGSTMLCCVVNALYYMQDVFAGYVWYPSSFEWPGGRVYFRTAYQVQSLQTAERLLLQAAFQFFRRIDWRGSLRLQLSLVSFTSHWHFVGNSLGHRIPVHWGRMWPSLVWHEMFQEISECSLVYFVSFVEWNTVTQAAWHWGATKSLLHSPCSSWTGSAECWGLERFMSDPEAVSRTNTNGA